jgi:hypothetical protein
MKYLAAALLAATALVACSNPTRADALNNLGFQVLSNPVPQSQSAPCVICATNQAHNPAGFGFNDFVNNGSTTSFNLFSSNITGAFGDGDDVTVTPYTSGQLRTFLSNLPIPDLTFTFGIAIDINTAGGPNGDNHFLDLFQLIDLDAAPGSRVIFDIRNRALPVIDNGNGKADYLLTGFDLTGVNLNDRLLFRAQWHGASDGGESFYIVPIINGVPVPGPIVGAGLPGVIAGGLMLLGLARRRRQAIG